MKTVYLIKREVANNDHLNANYYISSHTGIVTANKMLACHYEDYDSAMGTIRKLLTSEMKYTDNVLFSIEKYFIKNK